MVETFTPAVCGSRRRQTLALTLFAVGAVAAAAGLGALLGLAGDVLGARRALVGVALLALVAAAREAGLLRLPLPQARRQVPERWRSELPLPVWSLGYGAGLGAGIFTYQPFATFWVACAAAVTLARPLPAAACFCLFGAGRALMAALPKGADATAAVERLVSRRRALGRVNAAVLVVCAALLLVPAAGARPKVVAYGIDPSVSRGVLARAEEASGSWRVRLSSGETYPDAASPGLDGRYLAYEDEEGIKVVDRADGDEIVHAIDGPVSQPALRHPYLAYRHVGSSGKSIVLVDLDTGRTRTVMRVGPTNDVGRPSLGRAFLAWHRVRARDSRIYVLDLRTNRRRTVASTRRWLLTNPSVTGRHVIWVEQRPDSPRTQVLLRRITGGRVWVVFRLRAGRSSVWTTALEKRTAYVTRWWSRSGDASIYRVPF